MKRIHTYLFLLTTIVISTLNSCTKELDLDEDTRLLLDKKQKLEKLDELFDRSFDQAAEAESDYRKFVEYELLTETQNYLDDPDVKWRNARTDLAVRMNANFARVSSGLPAVLFDLYKLKFQTNILNRTLLGQSPQQLRNDERFARFKKKVADIDVFFDEKIDAMKQDMKSDEALANKNWKLENKFVMGPPDNPFAFFIINFDFTMKANNGMDIEKFFFFPYIPKPNASFMPQQDELMYSYLKLPPEDLLAPAEYRVYGNKIFFYFHLRNNVDPFNDGVGKLEREWIFEYEYILNGNNLTLTKPRMMLSMFPHLLSAEPGDDIYTKYYADGLKEFILNAN